MRRRKTNCAAAQKNIVLLLRAATILLNMSDQGTAEELADLFLDLWQENIRLWSEDKELLPLDELLALVSGASNQEADGD